MSTLANALKAAAAAENTINSAPEGVLVDELAKALADPALKESVALIRRLGLALKGTETDFAHHLVNQMTQNLDHLTSQVTARAAVLAANTAPAA